MRNLRKEILLSMLLSLTIILSIIELYIPIFSFIAPGFKIGFSNFVIMYILYKFGCKEAIYIGILKVIAVGLISQIAVFSPFFFISLVGTIFSIIIMGLIYKLKFISVIGVSIVGAFFHNAGQLLVVYFLLDNVNLTYLIPYILIISVIAGIITGIICRTMIEKVNVEI
ncbi:MAG: Gx transporter family protein [Bacilli bacterium]